MTTFGVGRMMDVGTDTTGDFRELIAERLADCQGLVFAMLYGSAATGEDFRDIDVGVWVDRSVVPAVQDVDYAFDLAELLEKAVPYRVDVRVINDAPLPFRYNVGRGVALVVNDRAAYVRFLERTWDDWLDFEPIAMQYLRDIA
jgi:predicted nucleotidyltransferase